MRRSLFVSLLVVSLLFVCGAAFAQPGGTAGWYVTATATSEAGTTSYTWAGDLVVGETFQADLTVPAIWDSNVALIKSLQVSADADPFVNLSFDVAGATPDVIFSITSAVTPVVPTIIGPIGYASAGVTLTSDASPASITGLFAGGKCYEARYNAGSVFADLLTGFVGVANDTKTINDRTPASGYMGFPGPLTSMQTQWYFKLGQAGDTASGTSRFEAVPEAQSVILGFMGLSTLAGFRRLRRK